MSQVETIAVYEAYNRRPMDGVTLFFGGVAVTGIEYVADNVYVLHNPDYPRGIPASGWERLTVDAPYAPINDPSAYTAPLL